MTAARRTRGCLLLLCAGLATTAAVPQAAPETPTPAMTTAQIVERMESRNQAQTARLKHYRATRHYTVEYRGFSKTIDADMTVRMNYDAGSGKSFEILSMGGSKLLGDRVLREAVNSEAEASHNPASTALTGANYTFSLLGEDTVDGHRDYVLAVAPIKPSKFLYRGRIWVDAEQFAVVKVDAEPARNPSFWISRATIRYTNGETDGFWLPTFNRSETKVRIGGTATLTIDYGKYQTSSD